MGFLFLYRRIKELQKTGVKTVHIGLRCSACVISGRCLDGVILSAERKIVDEDNRHVAYRPKLYQYYHPIIVGSSDHVGPFDNFRREALETAQSVTPQTSLDLNKHGYEISGIVQVGPTSSGVVPQKSVINLYPYIEKLSEIIRKYKSKYRSYDFDVIFATQIQGRGAFLEYIDDTGLPSDIYDSYKILGYWRYCNKCFPKIDVVKENDYERFHRISSQGRKFD